MNKKRGITTIDWVMSLSIFLLYISWFFIYIQPALTKTESPESLCRIVQEGLELDIYWTVNKQPLFIKSNQTAANVPIIANFNFNWNDFAFSDNRDYIREGNKIAFLANITNNTIVWLANSEENYTRQAFTTDLVATQDAAAITAKDFRAEFSKGVLDKATYKELTALKDFDIKIGQTSIDDLTTNYTSNKTYSIAYYKATTQALNSTNYIFAGNTQIEGILTPSRYSNTSVTIIATVRNYTRYYTNGNIMTAANQTGCSNYTTNYIDYYDSNGISFMTQETADYKTCNSNNSITLEITMPLKNETRYTIMLHTGDYNKTLNKVNYYTAAFGMKEANRGVSTRKMNSTNSTSAATLKARWNYPESRGLSFTLLNASDSTVYHYTTPQPKTSTNMYAKETDVYTVDKYGNKEKHKIRIKTW